MKWIVLTYLLLNPAFYLTGYSARDAQQVCFQLSSVILFALGMFFENKKVKFSKLNISIGVLLIVFALTWMRTQSGWLITRNLLYGVLVYITVIRTLKKEDMLFIFKGVSYLVGLSVIVLAFQVIGWDFRAAQIIGAGGATIAGVTQESIFFHRSAMGMYFAQHIPIVASFNIFLAPLLLIPMYYAQSMAAYLGAVIGFGFFLWFRKRILFWAFSVLVIVAVIAGLNSSAIKRESLTGMNIRLGMWSVIIQDIFQTPLGHGLDSFANPKTGVKYYNYQNVDIHETVRLQKDENGVINGVTEKDNEYLKRVCNEDGSLTYVDHPHNEYLWVAYEVGLQAWIILGFIFYFIWQRFRKSKRDTLTCVSMAVLICIAIECLLQFPLHLARVGYILPVILGVFYIATEEE